MTIDNIIRVSRVHFRCSRIAKEKGFSADGKTSTCTLASYVRTKITDHVHIVSVRPEKEVRYFCSNSVIRLIPFTVFVLITLHAIVY